MNHRYHSERPLTLGEAKVIFGYTSDHLAYLCRKGFIWATRHGRAWLTCEAAVRDYMRALSIAGRPVCYAEQKDVLKSENRLVFKLNLDSAIAAWDNFIDLKFPPQPHPGSDPFLLQLACEKVRAESGKNNFIAELFEADMGELLKHSFAVYREVLAKKSRLTKPVFSERSASLMDIVPGHAPARLPIGKIPACLTGPVWYRHEAVLVPALGVLIFALTVSQKTLLGTFVV